MDFRSRLLDSHSIFSCVPFGKVLSSQKEIKNAVLPTSGTSLQLPRGGRGETFTLKLSL